MKILILKQFKKEYHIRQKKNFEKQYIEIIILTLHTLTSGEWIPSKHCFTRTNRTMIDCFAICVKTTRARTRCYTFMIHTRLVMRAFRTSYALGSTVRWTSRVII